MMKKLFVGLLSVLFITPLAASQLYEPYGDELWKKQSDHKTVACDINFGSGSQITAATSNSWARGTLNGFMADPGYEGGRKEPDVERRISENVKRVTEFYNSHPNTVFALQEWNKQDISTLKQRLPQHIAILNEDTQGESFQNALLYNTQQLIYVKHSTSALASLNNLKWTTPNGGAGTQQDRYLHALFVHNTTGEILDVVNVHLKWSSSPADIQNALQSIFNSFANAIVMGDLNADLRQVYITHATILPSVNGSQTYNPTTKQGELKTNDAIIYKIAPAQSVAQPIAPVITPQPVQSVNPEIMELKNLLVPTKISPNLYPMIIDMYNVGEFNIDCVRLLATVPQQYQEAEYVAIFQDFWDTQQPATVAYRLAQRLSRYSMPAYQQPQPQVMPLPQYSTVNNNWGKFDNIDSYVKKHITGSLQTTILSAYHHGLLSKAAILNLGEIDFKQQKAQLSQWGFQ